MKTKTLAAICIAAMAFLQLLMSCNNGKAAQSDGNEQDISGKIALNSQTIDGSFEPYDFSSSKITLVYYWATWCSLCEDELPVLSQLYEDLKGKGFAVAAVLLDSVTADGSQNGAAIAKGKEMLAISQASFECFVPSEAMQKGEIQKMKFVPTALIVDSQSKVLKAYIGSRSLAEWKQEAAIYMDNE
ncbi:MAG: TlpA family protein disulfide reductase [Eubacteriaceae bacterium]|nr:TlpA family protein disulfide reductase [Eubacteriaceae bacterium]